MPDLKDGVRALRVLRLEIENTQRVEQHAAEAILKQAKRNAAARPTPQARMVASGMIARRGSVIGFGSKRVFGRGSQGSVKLGYLAFGSEFGSVRYTQFGRPWGREGYWLHPAAERSNPDIDKAEDRYLDQALDSAIRSAGP